MIKCEHKDCDYETGWTHQDGDENVFVDPEEGDFYQIIADHTPIFARRHRGENGSIKLLGCPKCRRVFLSKGQQYEDTTAIEAELKLKLKGKVT